MKRCFFILSSIFVITGCGNNSPTVKASKFEKLIAQYKEIDIDTFKVYSTAEIESDTFKFRGSLIDTTISKQFPKTLINNFYEKEYYACFKFSIDSTRVGLITRTPGEYASTSIKLLVFDKQKDAITDFWEIGEVWGDAGDVMDKTSWLFRDKEKRIGCFTWQWEGHDNSVNDEKDTTTTSIDRYYYIVLSKTKHDTLKRSANDLSGMFRKFILK